MDQWPHQERSASHERWPAVLVIRLVEYEIDETLFITSLSDRISLKFFVPRTFRRVVAANRRVEWLERETH